MIKNFKNTLKTSNGITLIALVITIIVLIILAGVSINLVLGNNGIITRARDARNNYQKAVAEEETALKDLDKLIDETTGSSGGDTTKDITKYQTGETKPYLPDSNYSVKEGSVDTGLVIKDKVGNEYVWVEVPKTAAVYPNAGLGIESFTDEECTTIAKDLATYSGSTLPSINSGETFAKHLPPTGEGVPDYTSAYKDVLKSIYQNGGFYVGRYETGIQGTENATTSARVGTSSSTEYPTEGNVAVIKENVQPYTWVRWGQAQTLAQGISAGKKGDKTSGLLMGVQWDLVLKFIGKKGDTDSHEWGNYADSQFDIEQGKYAIYKDDYTLDTTWTSEDTENYVVNGTKLEYDGTWDNCKGMILTTTGANTTKNSKKNICDIAGNVWEWTIENTSNSTYPCSTRGGLYSNTGSRSPASVRGFINTGHSYIGIGFRVSLY